MSRTGHGPRLRLFGPDARHGAKRRRGFRDYRWYVVWRDGGRRRERATGLGGGATPEERDAALAAFLAEQARDRRLTGPRHPDEMSVAEALAVYGEGHAPHTAAPWRIAVAIEALVGWWGETRLSAVTAAACRRYGAERKGAILAARRGRRAAVEARCRAAGRPCPPPVRRGPGSDGTVRRELGTLRAAINWCHLEGLLVDPPAVWLPDKPPSRERWLTRAEAARLLRAARAIDRHGHLTGFILLGLYTGARKNAILGLQWQVNTGGGHVDLIRGLIDFRRPGQPQTVKRRSAIPIPPRLLSPLRARRRRTRQYVLEYRGRLLHDVKRAFAAAAQAAGLPDVTPHTLRHTAVTWLVQAGVPLWEVGQWVGMSVAMIERVYGHHAPDRFRRVLEAQR